MENSYLITAVIFLTPFAILAGLMIWHRRILVKELSKRDQDLEQVQVRLKADHGIFVNRSHIAAAIAAPGGVAKLAEMHDGSLIEVLLRGKDVKAYFKAGDKWLTLPQTEDAVR